MRHDEEDGALTKVPLSTLYRWFMYDMHTDEPNRHVDIFNLTPVSDEGDDKEREDSETRTGRLDGLLPFLNLYANMTAQYIFEMQKSEIGALSDLVKDKVDKEADEIMRFYRQIAMSALITTFSGALELGVVHGEGTLTGVGDPDE